MGRPRRFNTVEGLEAAWVEYKSRCDNILVFTHAFSPGSSCFVSKNLKRSTTYTIKGFCLFAGLSRQNFYATYSEDPCFHDTVTRVREECEVDAREKFELGLIPSQLAGLWMANYGYGLRVNACRDMPVPMIVNC